MAMSRPGVSSRSWSRGGFGTIRALPHNICFSLSRTERSRTESFPSLFYLGFAVELNSEHERAGPLNDERRHYDRDIHHLDRPRMSFYVPDMFKEANIAVLSFTPKVSNACERVILWEETGQGRGDRISCARTLLTHTSLD